MSATRFLQLDVFPARTGGGNPLGVVIGADDWSAAEMQRFAAWTGLVETTFLLAPTVPLASYRLRIFTPRREIPFAGHPSIGSAHAALETALAQPRRGRLLQECGAGLLPIRVDGEGDARELLVQAPPARILHDGDDARAMLQPVLADRREGPLGPVFVEGGRRWWLAELADAAQVRQWQPDHAAIATLATASDSLGLCVFARCPDSTSHALVVRAFPAGAGIVEDPASGAANGLIAAFIAQREPHGPLARGYTVSQGRELGHDARITVHIDAGQVWVGGRTRTVIDSPLQWHPASSLAEPAESRRTASG